MKPKVYVETSIPSYLAAWCSRDLVVAGNQETTREWWDRRHDFDLYISEFVLLEVSNGDSTAAAVRLKALDGIPEIEITEEVAAIAENYKLAHHCQVKQELMPCILQRQLLAAWITF